MTDRYAVIGHPIAHSKSPLIHQMFAEQTGQDISYEKIEAPLDGFAAKIDELRKAGYKGCNVTVPFKTQAYQLSKEFASAEAKSAQAVNTMGFGITDIVYGENTDGIGLINDIKNNSKIEFNGKRVLLIGAGGAARGVCLPIKLENPKVFCIVNRDVKKAQLLVEEFRDLGTSQIEFRQSTFEQLSGNAFDIVINATSAGLTDSEIPLPKNIFAPGALAYDMMYGRETPFMKFAREQGARVADGLGMLVEQAAESFFLWRGVRPETAPVIAALRHP